MKTMTSVFVFLFALMFTAAAQDRQIAVIPVKGYSFTTDNLGNIYLYSDNEVIKYDPDGKLLQRYSDKKLGEITLVDAGNPFKVLVFYREQGVVRVLDNMMAPAGTLVRLNEAGYYQPWLITSSYNNNFWIYDKVNSALVRADLTLTENYRMENLGAITGIKLDPVAIDEYGNWLYLHDANRGILVFDIYGNYYKTIPQTSLVSFQPREESLILVREGSITEYNLKTMAEKGLDFKSVTPRAVRFEKDRMYILSNDELFIWR